MDDFLETNVARQLVDIVTVVNELADVPAHVTDAGLGHRNSFETFCDNGHVFFLAKCD
jgi:hypothetical protein